MTCIVGLVEKEKVLIGGDSAGVAGLALAVRQDEKVFRNGDFLFGFTSSFRMGQLLRYRFTPPRHHPSDDIVKFMSTDFVDGVRACLKEYGYAQKDKDQEIGGCFLVGFKGRLFLIDADYQVGLLRSPYYAVGCGAEIALGAMHATDGLKLKPEQRIKSALLAAEAYSAGVRGPFNILDLD